MLLEIEQEQLLCDLVEASRAVPRSRGQEFLYATGVGGPHLHHSGLRSDYPAPTLPDLEVLEANGLLRMRIVSSVATYFYIAPEGCSRYEEIKRRVAEPTRRLEESVRSYLASERFHQVYPVAFQRWMEAEEKLWGEDSVTNLTTIGHLCREALQDFVDALIGGQGEAPPKAHTVSRLRMILESQLAQQSATVREMLDAMVKFWSSVSDLIQRQEYGAQREGEELKWEDSRRVVFMTIYVMYEVDRTLSELR